ncbi:endonuclease domain-containing protein [Aquabacter cavernae]|uniref:endonuclease domain-containing protein n=1 Tax=Aquabacter cavernae TaxID=2496029 RepID=UPI001FE1AC8F|nr:DUF559 domain-containing protein [Aquabacter cavernae]
MADDPPLTSWRVQTGQRKHARRLRAGQTDAEQSLWSALRAHRLEGLSFRRQHPIGPFIADFACLPCRLVVELDGGQHYMISGRARDSRREAMLNELGFLVLRFSNLDVLENRDGVLEVIAAVAKERSGR